MGPVTKEVRVKININAEHKSNPKKTEKSTDVDEARVGKIDKTKPS